MEDKRKLLDTFLETYRLMHSYSMTWYRKNFNGIDPMQGQGRILSKLRRMHSINQRDLQTSLDIRPQSLGELLQKLETNGYIRRYRSPTDKRALIVELTEKGEVFQINRPEYDALFATLNRKEREDLRKSLIKISEQLENLIEKENDDDDFYY